jgi:hypothetical protein
MAAPIDTAGGLDNVRPGPIRAMLSLHGAVRRRDH